MKILDTAVLTPGWRSTSSYMSASIFTGTSSTFKEHLYILCSSVTLHSIDTDLILVEYVRPELGAGRAECFPSIPLGRSLTRQFSNIVF